MTASPNRRDFVKTLALGAAALAPAAKSYARTVGANDRIGIGMIGLGRMARGHLENLLAEPGAEVRALCDVYEPNLGWAAAKAPEAKTCRDFREVLGREDIDAVVIATPDHWHALPTVMACDAGKDVYVEKPSSVAVTEGRKMVEAARRNQRIVQVGTQQRSAPHFKYAVQLVRNGMLGDVTFVRTWNYGNALPDGIGNPAGRRTAGRPRLGHVARAGPEGPLQPEPLRGVPERRARVPALGELPLVLGLRRRDDDRLGRAPPRHRPVGPRR